MAKKSSKRQSSVSRGRRKVRIGVLDIQGSVEEHLESVRRCTAVAVPVKNADDLESVEGLILPGGESTTIGKLCERFGLREKLVEKIRRGFPVYGTCAGAILLSKWGVLNVEVLRNAYGRQMDSFSTDISCNLSHNGSVKNGHPEMISLPAVLIRAPKISEIRSGVRVLASHEGYAVLVRQDNVLASTFHPELTDDLRIHQYFISMVAA